MEAGKSKVKGLTFDKNLLIIPWWNVEGQDSNVYVYVRTHARAQGEGSRMNTSFYQ